jgi:hypothetical protein
LRGKTRHELACASCGAPLHELKMLRRDKVGDRDLVSPSRVRMRPGDKSSGAKRDDAMRWPGPVKPRKGKRRKGMFSKIVEEAFDIIEDIFD